MNWIAGYQVGSVANFSDDFVRDADCVTERREGEFDMLGQTWRCRGIYKPELPIGTAVFRVYERVR